MILSKKYIRCNRLNMGTMVSTNKTHISKFKKMITKTVSFVYVVTSRPCNDRNYLTSCNMAE